MTRLGILGGGQLAQMTLQAAVSFGLEVVIIERTPLTPAGYYTPNEIIGDWTLPEKLQAFAQLCDIVTLENEFVDAPVLYQLETWGIPLFPTASTVAAVQDKWLQKQTFQKANLPLPPFQAVESMEEAAQFADQQGYPVLLKARRNGYDGYGNATIHQPDDFAPAWERLATRGQLLVEAFVPFERELAVMVVRSRTGEIKAYPVVETIQKQHICHLVRAPANLPDDIRQNATDIAISAVEAIRGVGIFGVELFLLPDGQVLVNEIAPRPHNSGHYTIEACMTSQFENHIRAVMGWSLGSTALRTPAAVMVNLLGERDGDVKMDGIRDALAIEGAFVHLYGKRQVRKGRKMGHITAIADSIPTAEEIALRAAEKVNL